VRPGTPDTLADKLNRNIIDLHEGTDLHRQD
jgi:hypothetical protein